MKQQIIAALIACVFSLPACAQPEVRERVYLQTDKLLYLSGELLWMKLYTTDAGGQRMSLSKTGYVELLSDSIPEVQVKLDITDGTGAGWMELPAMLPTGYYRLIAYTRYMRNEGPGVFFERQIGVINPAQPQLPSPRRPLPPAVAAAGGKEYEAPDGMTMKPVPATGKTGGKYVIHLSNLPEENLSLAVSVAGVDSLPAAPLSLSRWKQQLAGLEETPFSDQYLPEYEGHIISGKLTGPADGRLPAGELPASALLSFPGDGIQLYGGKIDGDGNVAFHTTATAGKKEVATVVASADGTPYRIDVRSPFALHPARQMPPLRMDSTQRAFIEMRALGLRVMQAYTADSLSRIAALPAYFNYPPYRSFPLDDYTRFERMEEVFTEFITMVRLRQTPGGRVFNAMNEERTGFTQENTLVLLDNLPVADHERMASYNPLLVKTVDVYLGRYLFGGQLFGGIVAFRTYKGNYPGITFDHSVQIFDYAGTQPRRYFYSPVRATEGPPSRLPDFRHTLLWEPSIETQGSRELSIPFYASDLPGDYLITVEGIGSQGSAVSLSCKIKVMSDHDSP
jgi:hypothetical protein